MTSTNRAGLGDFDERLVEAIKSMLATGEQIIAQEEGDQGQAIALTHSSIIIAKAGHAATGELHGRRAARFDLKDVSAVNLRKGPLGAVIQICMEPEKPAPDGSRPDNVIVFTGAGRVKKAEAFVSEVELTDCVVNRISPRCAQKNSAPAIAEPIEESDQAEDTASHSQMAAEPQLAVVAEEIGHAEEIEEELEPISQETFNPNPRLPKAVKRTDSGPNRMLVALGVLAAMVFVGMAVMAPLRDEQVVVPSITTGTNELNTAKLQARAVANYLTQLEDHLNNADNAASTFKTALRSGDRNAILAASRSTILDVAFREVSELKAPPGLAAANEDIIGGLLTRKNAVSASAGAAASSSGTIDASGLLSRFQEADAKIAKGRAAMQKTRLSADSRVVELTSRVSKQKQGSH